MTATSVSPRAPAGRRRAGHTGFGSCVSQRGNPAELIKREALVERLTGLQARSVALLVAPVGYGKSALLAEWAAAERRHFAIARLTPADAEARGLLLTIGRALSPLDSTVRNATAEAERSLARRPLATLERTLRGAMGNPNLRCVLAIDNAHVLASESAPLLADLIEDLGPGAAVALASRSDLPLPVARLRAERRLIELGTSDLALTQSEVARLAAATGLELDEQGIELLARRTEGWAAGVYLAGLVAKGRSQPLRAIARFGGDDRAVADYVREEVLAEVPAEIEAFLVRTSILERVSGDLCDTVLERRGSATLLRRLARMNVLMLPLDRTDREYRYHPLFAEALRAELRRREPTREPLLHARASAWYEEHGQRDLAIKHAAAAGDAEGAGQLLWRATPALLGYGHCPTLMRQLRLFSADDLRECPSLALTAASAHLASGDRAMVECWTGAAARVLAGRPREPSLESGMLILQAAVSDGPLAEVRDQAARGYDLAEDASPWRAVACLVEGAARHLSGDREGARARLEEGTRRAALTPAIQVLCLAQLALLAIDDGEWDAAAVLATRARAQIERVELRDYPTAALVFSVLAAIHARFGHLDECDAAARHANQLLARLHGFTPWFTGECRIALAWAALRLSEQRTARRLLDEAAYELRIVTDAAVAHGWLDACRQQLDSVTSARKPDAEPLTKAELRVLQYLPTHLSFLEIAERLYVSTNTVKTHARAVYRKLAASSRSEAVLHAREAGLLQGAV